MKTSPTSETATISNPEPAREAALMAAPRVKEFSPELKALLGQAVAAQQGVFYTLGSRPAPNFVERLTDQALYMGTGKTADAEASAKAIPAWMFAVAWDHLTTHGHLSNAELIDTKILNVKRSSAVMAVLATLPGVSRVEGGPIALRYSPPPKPSAT